MASVTHKRMLPLGVLVLVVAAVFAGSASGFDPVGAVDLGAAGGYAVLGLEGTQINNSLVTINGDEGVSQGGKLTNMAPSKIIGDVHEFASGEYTGPGKLTGSIIVDPTLAQADADARAASTAAAALTPTQTFGDIGSNTTVTGNGGLNVIQVNGDITKSLILSGTASDIFVVNVTGTLTLGGSSTLGLAGGVTANHVLYNFTGSGDTISTHVGNVVNGTLLAPNDSFHLDGAFIGGIIGGGKTIVLMSGAVVTGPPPPGPPNATIKLAYADSYEPRADDLPSPWVNGVDKFVGCGSTLTGTPGTPGSASDPCQTFTDLSGTLNDQYDGGAIMIVNNSTSALTITDSSVVAGPCTYNPWPGLNVTLLGGQSAILTQTGRPNSPTPESDMCPGPTQVGPGFNFDTSEAGGNGHCDDSGFTPVITLTLNGVPTTITDTARILNHQGVDVGACPAPGVSEFTDWTAIS